MRTAFGACVLAARLAGDFGSRTPAAESDRADTGRRAAAPEVPQMDVGGDRDNLRPGDRLLLIVEHDPKFASILLEMAHQIGFKGLITSRGQMALAPLYQVIWRLRRNSLTGLDLRHFICIH